MRTKKKIEQTLAENIVSFRQIIDSIEQTFVETLKIPEAGERYLRLVALQQQISDWKHSRWKKKNNQIEAITNPVAKKGFATAFTGCAGLILGTFFPPAAIYLYTASGVLIAGGLGTVFQALKRRTCGYPKLEINEEYCLSMMNSFSAVITSEQERIEKNELDALLSSPKISDLCEKVSSIKDAFVKATLNEKDRATTVRLDKPSYKRRLEPKAQ